MKRDEARVQQVLEQFLQGFGRPAPGKMESARERVLERLRREAEHPMVVEGATVHGVSPVRTLRRSAAVAVAAAAVLAIVMHTESVRNFLWGIDAHSVVESADDGLYQVVAGKASAVQSGSRIEGGQIIQAEGVRGAVLVLADRSRIEMRSHSELSVETASDGIRIRLGRGSVVVNAAGQQRLYLDTKDCRVAVGGAVFLVDANPDGSRVSMIQGEAHVQQDSTSKVLLPGEQMTTNASMQPLSIEQAIAWSRNAAAHLTLMRRETLIMLLKRESNSNGPTPAQ